MADTPLDPNADERAARMAELKRKMQEKAKQAKAETAQAAPAPTAPTAPTAPAAPTAPTARPAPAAAETAQAVAQAEPAATAEPVVAAVATAAAEAGAAAEPVAAVAEVPAPRGNGAAAPPAPVAPIAAPAAEALEAAEDPAARARRMMNRREFLTYTWAAALGLVALQAGVGTFLFMYPRFKAGEFGGEFFIGPVDSMPPTDAPPQANTAGKFWLVNTTDEGIKALYMVCTHLGCLYKWEPSTVRFECPCHGSKFSREGFYIEGPAPRSLDTFEVREEAGQVIVDTGAKVTGAPSSESPDRAA